MLNNFPITKEAFIKNVILPFFQGLNHTSTHYIIYDIHGQILDINEETLRMFGYTNFEQIKNKTFRQTYKLAENYSELCDTLEQIRQTVIGQKVGLDHMCAADFTGDIKAYMMEHIPILYTDGTVIGTALTFNNLDHTTPDDKGGIFTVRQEEMIFLLSVGSSQKEAASILNTTRGTVAKTMENIGIRLNKFPGCSKHATIDKAAQIGCGKLPMGAIKPGIVQLSKLYNNTNILSLFKHF